MSQEDDFRVANVDDFSRSVKKMDALQESKLEGPKKKSQQKTQRRTEYYFTTARKIDLTVAEELLNTNFSPFRMSVDAMNREFVERFREEEKLIRKKGRTGNFMTHDNFRSRRNQHRLERLYVPEGPKLPGKSMCEDIDPEYYSLVLGRPTKGKRDIREYSKDVRECFLTRLKTGFLRDEVLQIEEQYMRERKRLEEVSINYKMYMDSFDAFLKEDHLQSVDLVKDAEAEADKTKQKDQVVETLRMELGDVKSRLLSLEEEWRTLRMFQTFLYRAAPVKWRKKHDRAYRKDKEHRKAEDDPLTFDRARGPSLTLGDPLELKLDRFRAEVAQSLPPAQYFAEPQQLLTIFTLYESTNLQAMLYCEEVTPSVLEAIQTLGVARSRFEKEQKVIIEEIEYLRKILDVEESKAAKAEARTKGICFGMLKDLHMNEEMLTIAAFVEDVYEDAVAPTDGSLDLVPMMKEIELKHEMLQLELDRSPNNIVVQATKSFYKEEARIMKEAQEAARKVHQMEILLRRLSKSLKYPKKGPRMRRLLFRSEPPQEAMAKYEPPKVLTKEEEEHQYFLEQFCRSNAECEVYRPLCG